MAADNAVRLDHLRRIFGEELVERLEHLSAALSESWTTENAAAMRRELHSLKGAARAVEALTVEHIAHAAEAAIPDGSPEARWFDAMHAALDAMPVAFANPDHDVSGVIAALNSDAKPRKDELSKPAAPRQTAEQGSVRVSLAKLDALLTESGELSVTQLRLSERLQEVRELVRELEAFQREWVKTRPLRARMRRAAHRSREAEALMRGAERGDLRLQKVVQRTREIAADLAQNTAQLATVAHVVSEEVMGIRLLPAGTMFAPFERMVRDLSRQIGKDARLELSGTNVELDRRILDELRDPLMHMVRNSLDHGLESSPDRARAGKSSQGRLRIAAEQRGDRVQIVVEDDGRGLDVEMIRETAVKRGLIASERAESVDQDTLIDLIFHPGFSTRSTVTELSGRGVGMDVVRDHVSRLGGSIRVQTAPGVGTTFTISVPLTLATTRVLLVGDGDQTYAVPSSTVERTGRVRAAELRTLEGRPAIQVDGRVVPVVELSSVLQRERSGPGEEWRPFFVLTQGERRVALLTDRLVDETELVVKGLGAPLRRVRHVSGAAVLGTGAVVVILSPVDLFKSALGNIEAVPRPTVSLATTPPGDAPKRRVMIVDDSVMTRTLERTILESAGYAVVVATDGAHALEMLNETPVDAIVSDVEMPRMTGLELTAAVRQDERLRHLPIVLVTSLDAPEHVERGAAAGADAYIVKGRFDQNDLLQTVGRLL